MYVKDVKGYYDLLLILFYLDLITFSYDKLSYDRKKLSQFLKLLFDILKSILFSSLCSLKLFLNSTHIPEKLSTRQH